MRQLTTSGGQVITLNPEQNVALDKMFIWYSSGGIYFRLSGFAGTGKTTITKFFIEKLRHDAIFSRPVRLCVCAPTHNAKKHIERSVGAPGHTLQRLLGLAPDMSVDEFDPHKPEFVAKRASTLSEYDLVVLDEASMVNKPLFKFINEHIGTRTKLLILGDPGQLPPVGEKLSVIFTSELIRAHAELTSVERNAGPIAIVSAIIRNNPTSRYDLFEHSDMVDTDEFGNETGIKFQYLKEFGTEVLNKFLSQDYIDDPNYAKIMTWRNSQASWWNSNLRRRRVAQMHPGLPMLPVMQGDILMAHQGYEGKIQNGNDYMVLHVVPQQFMCQYPKGNGFDSVVLDTYGTNLVNVDTGATTFAHILDQDNQKNVDRYMKAHWAYVGMTKDNKDAWQQYFMFRAWCMLMHPIQTRPDGKFTITKDLDYAYAITTHKAQGREYNNVFVDAPDMNANWSVTERNSLKYVAISRAMDMVYYRES